MNILTKYKLIVKEKKSSDGTFNNSAPNNKKKLKLNKSHNLAFLKGYIYIKGISEISTINASKWQRSAETWKFSRNARFLSTEAPLD